MYRRTFLGILVFLACLLSTPTMWARNRPATPPVRAIEIDLAATAAGEVTTRPGGIDAGYTILLTNVIPRLRPYHVSVEVEDVEIPPLPFDFGGAKSHAMSFREASRNESCLAAVKAMFDRLSTAESEVAVKDIGDEALLANPGCTADIEEQFDRVTRQEVDKLQPYAVKPWQTLTITVKRPGGGPTWTVALPGRARGEWRTSYGFFFVPDRDERYFAKEEKVANQPSKFTVEKQQGREDFDFVPTILFNFVPATQLGKTWMHGWVAGLGYDLEKPFVLAGYSGVYNENIVFTGGVAFHRQSRLRGRYEQGDPLSEALEPEQLVEDTYGPNLYVGIGFRFGNDVHARRQELEKETSKAKADAAAAKARLAQAEKDAAVRKADCEAQANAVETAAKEKCQTDACRATAEAAGAAARAKCAVTEQDRRDAEAKATAAAVKAAAEKDLLRKRCEEAAEAVHKDAVEKCAGKPASCKTDAEKILKQSLLKCLSE